jgi:hypothetical protein
MKKLLCKTPLHTLTAELIKVKGGTDPATPNPGVPPLDDPDNRTHIVDLG